MHNQYFIITLYITAFLHDHPTVHLPSISTPFCMDNLLSALSSFCKHNLLYALSAFYMDSLYFTFTLRTAAVLCKHPTLHIPSALSPCYMTNLLVQYQKFFKIKTISALFNNIRSEFNSWCVVGIFPSYNILLIRAEALGSAKISTRDISLEIKATGL